MNSRKFFTSMLTAIALTIATPFANAADPVIPSTHNPYTVLGVQLRSVLLADDANGSSAISLGPAIFQEIVPCRFISTLDADHYPVEWGGPAFQPNESRSYRPTGELVSSTGWVNPCSQQIPVESLAVAARIWATGTKSTKSVGNTVVYLTPGHDVAPPDKLSKIALIPGEQSMNEAAVVLKDHMFTMTTAQGGADLQVDIIGYFITDTYGVGPKGDKGDTGATGPAGPAGPQGAKGDQGLQGLQGDKGDKGDQGLQGDKGAKGDQGLQGDKGDKGDIGPAGPAGPQGAKGDKGDKGDQGLAGPQGAQGPMGPQGPQGIPGPPGRDGSGAWVSSVNCMAQGENSVTLQSSAVHADSAILVTVVGRSLGNTISVLAQGEGWVTISGKPATCFRYIVFN